MKYRCPTCNAVADIDFDKRVMRLKCGRGPVFPKPGHVCILAKGIDDIKLNLDKLEKVA